MTQPLVKSLAAVLVIAVPFVAARLLVVADGLHAPALTTEADGAPTDDVTAELDAFWAEGSRTVAEGDFEGYAATYHPDAVLVNETRGTTYPISKALAGWKSGFDDTKAGKMKASVAFRFTKRLHDATTAHETGIFDYVATPAGGEPTRNRVHFEGLLVKKAGKWQLVMEYQQHSATDEEWAAAGEEG